MLNPLSSITLGKVWLSLLPSQNLFTPFFRSPHSKTALLSWVSKSLLDVCKEIFEKSVVFASPFFLKEIYIFFTYLRQMTMIKSFNIPLNDQKFYEQHWNVSVLFFANVKLNKFSALKLYSPFNRVRDFLWSPLHPASKKEVFFMV